MKLPTPVSGHGLRLRSASPEDAEFILSLRLDPGLARFLGDTSPDVEAQREWMRRQEARDGDLYFIIETLAGAPLGTVGIYDITPTGAEWGRWILKPGVQAAMGSVLLVYQVAFEQLGLERVYSRTVEDNGHVVSFHDSCGVRRIGVETGGVKLRGVPHNLVVHELERSEWPAVRERLQPLARMAARFL